MVLSNPTASGSAQLPERDRIALIALTATGAELAWRIARTLPTTEIYGLARRVQKAHVFFEETGEQLRELFLAHRPIVGICASGILIRALSPILHDKLTEAAVLAMSDSGDTVVPLLGGHHGGGNRLARTLALITGGHAALTNASDQRFGLALDEPPEGHVLANPHHHKDFVATLLAGAPVFIHCDPELTPPAWIRSGSLPIVNEYDPETCLEIYHTHQALHGNPRRLVYHPRTLAIGVGCERDTTSEELTALVEKALTDAILAPQSVAGIFSLDRKIDEPAVHALANTYAVPARFFNADLLETFTPRLPNPSPVVFREVGCHGVAEAAALAASGDNGILVVEKTRSTRATCAIAASQQVINAIQLGQKRGVLSVVGIGPGGQEMRSPAASEAISAADHVIGYRLYLELIGELLASKTVHPYSLGEETDRVKRAFELASDGSRVALVCSGDAGIYAMASLVYEMLAHASPSGWDTIEIEVVPGISALQAAAARAGAPLGHDFCAVSLSDRLTPWEVIEKRLNAAGSGDFVIALYNPISRKRVATFERALSILREHRAPDTVVVIAKNLGRREESVRLFPLDELQASHVDMFSIVLIGASLTQIVKHAGKHCAYTPRGYRLNPLPTDGIRGCGK